MRIFTGGVVAETNTFAPFPTGLASFQEGLLLRRGEGVTEPDRMDICRVFIERAAALGWEVFAGLRAIAQAGGRIPQPVYEALRDELLDDLRAATPVDAVLLGLHGAMVATGEDDGEGDILARVRGIVGPDVPIGVHHDPHAHLTARMVENADVIRMWRHYPHTDIAERAGEVFDLIAARLAGAPRAIPVVHDCGMAQMLHTTREPMRAFVGRLGALESRDGIQSISIAHSFPWGDVPDMGTKVLVYAENERYREKAESLAAELGQELWELREAIAVPMLSLDDALDRGFGSMAAPVVIADGSDNPGSGAPGDSTYFLRRLLERGDSDWAIGYLYDPQALRIAFEAGPGAQIRLRIGGKICQLSGEPVDVDGTVSALARNVEQRLGEVVTDSGDAAAIDLGDNRHIVLISVRAQTASRNVFDDVSVDLGGKRVVIVKSANHFHASFSEVAGEILYTAAPGVVTPDLRSLAYRHADTTLWPLCAAREH